MISAFLRAIGQVFDPKIRTLLLCSAFAALLFLTGASVGLWFGLRMLMGAELGWLDWVLGGWGAVISLWFFFPSLLIALSSLFSERIAAAVENRYYPQLPPARAVPLTEELRSAVMLLFKGLLVNLFILPLYVVTGPGAFLIFYGANGFLIGLEYFQTIALRRLPLPEAQALAKSRRGQIWLAGSLLTLLASLPFLNLLMPILATAFMIHLFEQVRPQNAVRF